MACKATAIWISLSLVSAHLAPMLRLKHIALLHATIVFIYRYYTSHHLSDYHLPLFQKGEWIHSWSC